MKKSRRAAEIVVGVNWAFMDALDQGIAAGTDLSALRDALFDSIVQSRRMALAQPSVAENIREMMETAGRVDMENSLAMSPSERTEVTYALKPLDEMIDDFERQGSYHGQIPLAKQIREMLAKRLAGCVVLPGWRCSAPGCSGWMGEEKEALQHCRVCGAPRRT